MLRIPPTWCGTLTTQRVINQHQSFAVYHILLKFHIAHQTLTQIKKCPHTTSKVRINFQEKKYSFLNNNNPSLVKTIQVVKCFTNYFLIYIKNKRKQNVFFMAIGDKKLKCHHYFLKIVSSLLFLSNEKTFCSRNWRPLYRWFVGDGHILC